MSLVDVWTRLPLITANRRLNFNHRTILSVSDPITYDNVELQGEKNWVQFLSTVINRAKKSEFGVGSAHKAVWKDEYAKRVKNGLVVVAEFDSYHKLYDWDTQEVEHWRNSNFLVYVIPLWFHYAVARFGLGYKHVFPADYRLPLIYGRYLRGSVNKYKLDTFEKTQNQFPQLPSDATAPGSRKIYVVQNGDIVDPFSYCEQCPKKLQWSLGLCAFAKYQCVVGTHFMDAMSLPDPDYDSLFGNNYSDKAECINRAAFESYYGNNLTLELNSTTKQAKAVAQAGATRAANTRKLKTRICGTCELDKLNPKCDVSPHYCDGPYLAKDIAWTFTWRPWQMHSFFLSGTEVPASTVNNLVNTLRKLKTRFTVKRPIPQTIIAEERRHNRKLDEHVHYTQGTQSDQRCVVLGRNSKYDPLVIISYSELCAALGIDEINSEDELNTAYPLFKELDWHALFMLIREVKHIYTPIRKFLLAEYDIQPSKITLKLEDHKKTLAYYNLTHGRQVYYALLTGSYCDERRQKIKRVKQLVKDGTLTDKYAVSKFLIGEEDVRIDVSSLDNIAFGTQD